MPPETRHQFGYRKSPDQSTSHPVRHPVIIVGAGPVGLTLALDLAGRGIPVVLLDDADRIGAGSRAICFAKRTLEIFDRLGVAAQMIDKGVVWQKGKVFLEQSEIFEFDLLPESGHHMPAFINLQQYYVEQFLADAAASHPGIDLRWRNRVSAIETLTDGATITIDTPDGPYRTSSDWLVCCDGARSPCRSMLNLEFKGEAFEDQFLIADVRMNGSFPTERWFWFDPPFHSGRSALLHRQPDDIWRIDLQLGSDADAEQERRPDNVSRRIERMLGHGEFSLEWVSVYRFQSRRLEKFVHGRVLFAGDSAHQVSPFGARGANSGIQDADNLGWKIAAIIDGRAPIGLIDSYEIERGQAADENIRISTSSTNFIAPRSAAERRFRNAALHLAGRANFAKRFVNSGRLSLPTEYDSPLNTLDADPMPADAKPGSCAIDLPLAESAGAPPWLLQRLGLDFTVLHVGKPPEQDVPGLTHVTIPADTDYPKRYGSIPGSCFLIRPDGYVCARFKSYDPEQIERARDRALAITV